MDNQFILIKEISGLQEMIMASVGTVTNKYGWEVIQEFQIVKDQKVNILYHINNDDSIKIVNCINNNALTMSWAFHQWNHTVKSKKDATAKFNKQKLCVSSLEG